jgi:hypothetical protein
MTVRPAISNDARMRALWIRADGSPAARLVDAVLDGYVEWREDAASVADAYTRWSSAPRAENAVRFAAYTAALDQEQSAASAYAQSISELERWLPRCRNPARIIQTS